MCNSFLPASPHSGTARSLVNGRWRCGAVAVLLFVCGGAALRAQLVLNVNPDTQTMWLSGTASGTPADMDGSGRISWDINQSGTWTSGGFNFSSGLNSSVSTVTSGFVYQPLALDGRFGVAFNFSSGAATAITGNGTVFSYAGFGPFARTALETGGSLSLTTGTGFGNFTIASVPEPATLALVFGAAALASTQLVRRRRLQVA